MKTAPSPAHDDRPHWEVAPPFPLKRYFLGDCEVFAEGLNPDVPLYADAPTAEEAAERARLAYRIPAESRVEFVQVLWRTEDGEKTALPLTAEAALAGMADLRAMQRREEPVEEPADQRPS